MTQNQEITGLTENEVIVARGSYGRNTVVRKKTFIPRVVADLVKDPMVILLIITAVIYLITGNQGDAIFMLTAVLLVTGISLYQDSRSRNALAALKKLTQPTCKVIRDGETKEIAREDVVVGDIILVNEGTSIPADAIVLRANDFTVDESILTGESLPVAKSEEETKNKVFQGTLVSTGLGTCRVVAIGSQTELGKIGKSLEEIEEGSTPLQVQIRTFVKKMAYVGGVIFLMVWGVHYFLTKEILQSLLKALTLAMSILPEEIPVAFTTFMALGAWRLMQSGLIVKRTQTVETLGSATVICIDKTGTITENRMTLAKIFALSDQSLSDFDPKNKQQQDVITVAMWASEPIPFDPMELALHQAYSSFAPVDERKQYHLYREYNLEGKPPMMTHVFQNSAGQRIIAAKGATEALLRVSDLTSPEREAIEKADHELSKQGFRVLGVGLSTHAEAILPDDQLKYRFTFKGLVAFYDPPKKDIAKTFEDFYKAGIKLKIITGDNAATTATIAKQVNFIGADKTMNGDELLKLSESELRQKVKEINIFTRMFPEAKLRILHALKANGEIVAMTGDGVNDGPALKAAHIGIAMGKKGTELAKQVSSLIITDDNLARMVDAIAMGRKIYTNLKKAIQYIISIHIPIILTVLLPLLFGWVYPAIFSPVHIIFLELIMGPTCSIIYENEPMEKNLLQQKPRPFSDTFFNLKELSTSLVQGLVITAGTLFVYQFAVTHGSDENDTRTMVFVTLITSNIFLTLVNRSFYYSLFHTMRYHNNLMWLILAITTVLTTLIVAIPSLRKFFEFDVLSTSQIVLCLVVGSVCSLWFEGVKVVKRMTG